MIGKTQTVMRSNSDIGNNRAFYVALHMNGTVDEIETKKRTRYNNTQPVKNCHAIFFDLQTYRLYLEVNVRHYAGSYINRT